MNKTDLINWFNQKISNEKNVQIRTCLIDCRGKVGNLEEDKQAIIEEDLKPKEIVFSCLEKLKSKKQNFPQDSVDWLILNRVIKDIEFTSNKFS